MRRTAVAGAALGLGLWAASAFALPYVYVTDSGSDSVYAIDAATNVIARTVPALGGADAVAVSSDGTRAYIAEGSAGAIAVIDPSRLDNPSLNPVVSTLAVGGNPVALALGPSDRYLYVADAAADAVEKFDLSTIDPANPVAVATYAADPGLVDMALSPDGQALALASTSADKVAFYDFRHLVNGAPVRTDINLPSTPAALAFADDGATLWIATASGFSSYARASGKVTSNTVSGGTDSVAYAARGPELYFGSATGDVVYSYDPVGAARTTISVSGAPAGLAVSPDGTRVYVAQDCAGCGLAVIDTAQNKRLTTVVFGQSPATRGRFAGPGVITATNGSTAGVADQQFAGNVTAVDAQQRALAYSVITPPASGQLTLDSTGNFVYTPATGFSGVDAFVWQAAAVGGVGSPNDPVSRPVTESLVVTPALSAFSAQTVMAGASVGPLSFSVDGTTPLAVAVTSNNTAVIDPANAVISPGCGTSVLSCTLTLKAGTAAGQSATVTVTVTDPNYLDSQQTFKVMIQNTQPGGGGGGAVSPAALAALMGVLLLAGLARRRRA